MILTYNKRLKDETKEKIDKLGLKNTIVHNYHTFGCTLEAGTYNDTLLLKIIRANIDISYNFDIIIIDEIQDMNYIYYELVQFIISKNIKKCNICVFGDYQQCIFKQNGSDERFILITDKIFNTEDKWEKLKLSNSYRLTIENAEFVNYCIKENRINSIKHGTKPIYYILDVFNKIKCIALMIQKYISSGYKYDDIFILCPSISTNINASPIHLLENYLVAENMPIYAPTNDFDIINNKIIKNKIVISTFHKTKGLERKIVFVLNFDSSYHTYYNNENNNKLTNALYVAITRAIDHLIIIHHYANDYMKYIDIQEIEKYCKLIIDNKVDYIENQTKTIIGVDKYIKNIDSNILDNIYEIMKNDIKEIKSKKEKLYIPKYSDQIFLSKNNSETTTETAIEITEQISDLCGIAIPLYYEKNKLINIKTIFIEANKKLCKISKYKHKMNQITDYNWCNEIDINSFMLRLEESISTKAKYEIEIKCEYNNINLIGSIDCIDENNILELKIVDKLLPIHFLQIAIYKFIYINPIIEAIKNKYNILINIDDYLDKYLDCNLMKEYKNIISKKFILFNILDDNQYEINVSYDKLKNIIDYINNNKYNLHIEPDEEFTNKCNKIMTKYKKNNLDNIIYVSKYKNHKIVIDIETDGISKIIQVSYLILDDTNKIIDTKEIIINDLSKSCDYYGKITIENKIKNGISYNNAITIIYNDLKEATEIIGHNIIAFDMKYLIKAFTNCGLSLPNNIIIFDTQKIGCPILKLKNKIGIPKMPSLKELYEYFNYKIDIEKQHNANYDIIITYECYVKLKMLVKN